MAAKHECKTEEKEQAVSWLLHDFLVPASEHRYRRAQSETIYLKRCSGADGDLPVAIVDRISCVELVDKRIPQHHTKKATSKCHDGARHVVPLVQRLGLNGPAMAAKHSSCMWQSCFKLLVSDVTG